MSSFARRHFSFSLSPLCVCGVFSVCVGFACRVSCVVYGVCVRPTEKFEKMKQAVLYARTYDERIAADLENLGLYDTVEKALAQEYGMGLFEHVDPAAYEAFQKQRDQEVVTYVERYAVVVVSLDDDDDEDD